MLFVVGILLPGIMLVVFAGRALLQERRLAAQEIRERLDRTAAQAGAALEAELARWQSAVDEVAAASALAGAPTPTAPSSWPAFVREAVEAPDGAMLLVRRGEEISVAPPGRLPFALGSPSSSPIASGPLPGLAQAERAERDGDYRLAIERYEQLLTQAEGDDHASLLHRLARTLRKAGEPERALEQYEELKRSATDLVGTVPAGLVAMYEICSSWQALGNRNELMTNAHELYGALVAGRWVVEKPRYLFYSEEARRWSGLELLEDAQVAGEATSGAAVPSDLRALRATEVRKLAFAANVEAFLSDPGLVVRSGSTLALAFWNAEPFVALVMPAALAEARIWEPVVADVGEPDVSLALHHDDGSLVFAARAHGAGLVSTTAAAAIDTAERSGNAASVTRELRGRAFPLAVQARPASPSGLQRELAARQIVYVGMLTFVVVLLVFGSYLTARTVRHEVEVARLKSRFVSTVSHEFRSPLTGIHQLSEMLMRNRVSSDEKKQSYYRMIARESSRLTRLVENVLDFSRIEEDRKEYAIEPVDTSAWLSEVVKEFRHELHDQNVILVANVPDGLPRLRGDREALTCAVHNLLDNAVKYSRETDTVRLDAEASDGRIAVHVCDRGIGISEENRRRVFEKFFRADETAEAVKGVGLGLSLVQHIVAAHGGSIRVDSEPGIGSTFTIELPTRGG